mgnify:FL=1
MECQYKDICKSYGFKSKVMVKEKASIKGKFGDPDLIVLFTNTASHKMVNSSVNISKKKNIPVVRCHSSSASALKNILKEFSKEVV